jgi:type I restriction enzyme S subunit
MPDMVLKGLFDEVRKYKESFKQSILGKAFRGELAPQDANDEPASVLLERIRERSCESTAR